MDEESGRIEVVVPNEQLSLAIGRRGQNVRLASQLTGWHIDILTEEEESQRRQEEFHRRSALFIEALDVDDVIAHLLVTEGFTTVEEVAYVPLEELADIEGFDEEVAEELRLRAQAWLEEQQRQNDDRRRELGVDDALAELDGLTSAMLVTLGEGGIKTLDDLADLASDELLDILGSDSMTLDEANDVIMAARAHWFDEEPAASPNEAEMESESEDGADSEPEAETESQPDGETQAEGDGEDGDAASEDAAPDPDQRS